jgi:hypothetical protein
MVPRVSTCRIFGSFCLIEPTRPLRCSSMAGLFERPALARRRRIKGATLTRLQALGRTREPPFASDCIAETNAAREAYPWNDGAP